MLKERPNQGAPFVLTIFGASGDLTRRKLVPALFDLFAADLLPKRFFILGYARRDWDRAEFVQRVSGGLWEQEGANTEMLETFFAHFVYQQGDFAVTNDYHKLHERLDSLNDQLGQCGHRLFYMATAAENYHQIMEGMKAAKLQEPCDEAGWTRLIVEKPFGHDLKSAQKLDAQIGEIFTEEQIYRIDHYLAKETVQNILAFRFANSIFENIWSAEYIDRIEIVVSETEGVGTRGNFYDKTGAIRDVLQNHLLQLLALTTMEEPIDDSATAFREARARALGALKVIGKDELNTKIILGQYEGYHDVVNVDPKSTTETFVALEVEVETQRWAGMPVYLATGKALAEHWAGISVYLKRNEMSIFGGKEHGKNYNNIVFNLQPNASIKLELVAKKPGYEDHLQPVKMHFSYQESFGEEKVDAYSRLILDAIIGDQRLFTRSDEVEAEWKFIDPIIENRPRPVSYKVGSTGPDEAAKRLRSL